ncbi:uncharacterized protein LOC133328061, partial [Musca vetustissima]|uniref:uncharacterized protein LOC133328061 n=1 Tax=Musca vetustissima TaxID=27455 RepID=UPI002AB6E93F
MDVYLIPDLENCMYCGIDFWKEFNVAPKVISSLEISSNNEDSDAYVLSPDQLAMLEKANESFRDFDKHGLGKTTIKDHVIDTGDAVPIKQRHYPVSPVVESLIYQELDRMISLGVIEPSTYPLNSPVTLVRRGMASCFRRFIRDYAEITAPITNTLKKGKSFCFDDQAIESFNKLKVALTTSPVLSHTVFDKRFYVQCDASNLGMGAVLYQLDAEGLERPIAFHSAQLSKAERNYSVTGRECLAIISTIQKSLPFIELMPFTVVTDHNALKWPERTLAVAWLDGVLSSSPLILTFST